MWQHVSAEAQRSQEGRGRRAKLACACRRCTTPYTDATAAELRHIFQTLTSPSLSETHIVRNMHSPLADQWNGGTLRHCRSGDTAVPPAVTFFIARIVPFAAMVKS